MVSFSTVYKAARRPCSASLSASCPQMHLQIAHSIIASYWMLPSMLATARGSVDDAHRGVLKNLNKRGREHGALVLQA